jgi:hypothetical protein
MSTKTRLATLEKQRAASEPGAILVYLQGPDGKLRRTDAGGHLVEELTQAEYDRKYPDSIHVRAESEEEN